uniref:Uncharacterized protein n=1 Tax=Trichinella nativa TaxID=6335 RepID=A0A0V1KIE7_9BILA
MKNVKYTSRTWVLATKMKNVENETQTLTWSMARKLKIMETEKHTLFDLEYGEKHSET